MFRGACQSKKLTERWLPSSLLSPLLLIQLETHIGCADPCAVSMRERKRRPVWSEELKANEDIQLDDPGTAPVSRGH